MKTDWHRRRNRRLGGSEVGAALIASGTATSQEIDSAPKYMLEAASRTEVRLLDGSVISLPYFIARKLGLREAQRQSKVMARGLAREEELLSLWSQEQETRIVLARDLPTHARHAIDHDCDSLAVTFDALAEDEIEGWIPLEAKCPYRVVTEVPWYWRLQVQAQIAVAMTDVAVIVIGPGWGACDHGGGAIWSSTIERDDRAIERIRSAAEWTTSIMRSAASAIESTGQKGDE